MNEILIIKCIFEKKNMNILTEIVDLLSDQNNSLASALLKIKVLSSRLNNSELSEWLNKEIGGYSSSDSLPKYRVIRGIIKCNCTNGPIKYTSYQVQEDAFPKNNSSLFTDVTLRQDISSLESISEEKFLKFNSGDPTIYFINNYYQNMGNPYFSAYSAWVEISAIAIKELLSKVRVNALNLVLELESNMGYEIEIEELIRKKIEVNKIINNIMNQTVITNIGDGNFVNSGDSNVIDNDVKTTRSKLDELKYILEKNMVEESDIRELEEILIDEPKLINNKFSNKINNWLKNMLNKAIDGSWQIGLGAAGNILSEAINKYYNS